MLLARVAAHDDLVLSPLRFAAPWLFLAACSSTTPEASGTASPASQPSASAPAFTASSKPVEAVPLNETPTLDAQVEAAKADLTGHLGVAAGEIAVKSVRKVQWRNAALGCAPPEGGFFAQVITPGAQILLEHGGVVYAYHSGRDGVPFRCTHPQPPYEGDALE